MPRLVTSFLFLFLTVTVFTTSCYRMRKSSGGGQIAAIPDRNLNATDIALHPGYKIEPVASGFTFPTAATVDDEGKLYVIEAGYSYGVVFSEPKLFRVETDGHAT